jgi:hypothetical protein
MFPLAMSGYCCIAHDRWGPIEQPRIYAGDFATSVETLDPQNAIPPATPRAVLKLPVIFGATVSNV